MKNLARFFLWLTGWKIQGSIGSLEKALIIGAPHTSNWDFFYGLLFKMYYGLSVRFLMKKELFRFPFRIFFKNLGGIPVDRSRSTQLVEKLAEEIRKSDHYLLAMAPEGTRKRVQSWKMGFYHIAKRAEVPIVLGYMDYGSRVVGIGPTIIPGDNMAGDLAEIGRFYSTITAKYPEKFSPPAGF